MTDEELKSAVEGIVEAIDEVALEGFRKNLAQAVARVINLEQKVAMLTLRVKSSASPRPLPVVTVRKRPLPVVSVHRTSTSGRR